MEPTHRGETSVASLRPVMVCQVKKVYRRRRLIRAAYPYHLILQLLALLVSLPLGAWVAFKAAGYLLNMSNIDPLHCENKKVDGVHSLTTVYRLRSTLQHIPLERLRCPRQGRFEEMLKNGLGINPDFFLGIRGHTQTQKMH